MNEHGQDQEYVEAAGDLAYTQALTGPSSWPKVIGILAIIYGSIGITCQGMGVVGIMLAPIWRAMAGINIDPPPVIQILTYVGFAIFVSLGILLVVGGVRLCRRRSRGVANLKAWAVMRLVMVVIWFVASYLTIPANVEMQRTITESVNKKLAEANRPPQPFDEDTVYRRAVIGAAVGAGVVSIFPLFLGFYLSRRRIDEEIGRWDEALEH